jgi:hypothetical protein
MLHHRLAEERSIADLVKKLPQRKPAIDQDAWSFHDFIKRADYPMFFLFACKITVF